MPDNIFDFPVNFTSSNASGPLVSVRGDLPDTLDFWAVAYFKVEVTTSLSSQKEQKRDLRLFLEFMGKEEGCMDRIRWTPRLSRRFIQHLQEVKKKETGTRQYSDRTINRILAHLKTFSKWVHKMRAFPLDNPMAKIKSLPVTSLLEIERALTPCERRRLLDAADLLPLTGGRSRNKRSQRKPFPERKQRKGYRPYRSRAMMYCLIETRMRRAAISNLDLANITFNRLELRVQEKGGGLHTYRISREGLQAIQNYLDQEREIDNGRWQSAALFLPSNTVSHSSGRLTVRIVNEIWNEVCELAGVSGRTPHSARHAMGRHVIEKTGNLAAVQKILGHKNAAYSMQYARITGEELIKVLEER